MFLAVAFFVIANSAIAAAFFAAQRFFVASEMAFLPAAESCRLGFDGSGMAFDVGSECVTVGFFAFPADACTAPLARATAAFASRSSSWMWGTLAEDRSVTSDINASILPIRLRIFFAFMTTPVHIHSPDLRRRVAPGGDEFHLRLQPIPARLADY